MNNSSATINSTTDFNKRITPGGPMRRTRSGDRLTRFVFTLNNYTQQEYDAVCATDCKWMVVGKETGDSNTPHLQGAIVLNSQLAFNTIKKLPGLGRAHIERMHGQPSDSLEYCTKEDKQAFTKGTMPKPGKRNDILQAVTRIQEGESLRDLAKDAEGGVAVVKWFKGLTVLRSLQTPTRTNPPTILWLHGATGTGKTASAISFAEALQSDYWISHGNLQWFDNYDGQRVAILDDYRTNHCSFSFLLRLLDRYRLYVPFKGGFVNWVPEYIIVTAPKSPTDMWNLRSDEDLNQLSRRVTATVAFDSSTDKPSLLSFLPESIRSIRSDESVSLDADEEEVNVIAMDTTESHHPSQEEVTQNLFDLVTRNHQLTQDVLRASSALIDLATTEEYNSEDSGEEGDTSKEVIDLTEGDCESLEPTQVFSDDYDSC